MPNADIESDFDAAVTMRPAVLGRIDQYELMRELGGGGFGCVYLARDTTSDTEVAVKGLPPEVKHNREELENIRANFALIAPLHHPNIAAALVLHPVEKASYTSRAVMEKLRVLEGDTLLVMEYAPGMTLSNWRKQFPDRRVPREQAVDVIRQIAGALDYAHALKIVHRDVKPANVMVNPQPDGSLTVKVLDFGLAAEVRSSMGRVSREIRDTTGTRPYMAPEQWTGDRQGPAADQYALAVVFCELLSGEIPFQSAFESGDPDVMRTSVVSQPVRLPESVPAQFRKSLLRALSKRPSERFARCSDLVSRPSRFPTVGLLLGAALVALVLLAVPRLISPRTNPEMREREILQPTPQPPQPVVPPSQPTTQPPQPVVPPSQPTTQVEVVVKPAQPVAAESPPRQKEETPCSDAVGTPRLRDEADGAPGASQPQQPSPAPSAHSVSVSERYPMSKELYEGTQAYDTDYRRLYQKCLKLNKDAGDADAQFCLGWMCKEGLGTSANPQQARKYLQKSADGGNDYARKLLKEMGK